MYDCLSCSPGGRSLQCHVCGKALASWATLQRHVRDIHCLQTQQFWCFRCRKPYRTRNSLLVHNSKYHPKSRVSRVWRVRRTLCASRSDSSGAPVTAFSSTTWKYYVKSRAGQLNKSSIAARRYSSDASCTARPYRTRSSLLVENSTSRVCWALGYSH